MIENPLISVLIPVYNVKRYLSECIESVINQTYQNIEILIIDDGSTDGSSYLCDLFAKKDERIIVIHTENRGLSSARNLGISSSRGSYLLFVDSDDWIESNAVETLFNVLIENNVDVVAAKYCGEYINRTIHSPVEEERIQVFRGNKILPTFVNGRFGDVTWNKLYVRNCFSEISFPEDRCCYEDLSTTWKVLKKLDDINGGVAILAEDLFHYRFRKSSISNQKALSNITDCWKAYLEKYQGLQGFQDQLLQGCIKAMGRLLLYYGGFSANEKKQSSDLILEMKLFSRTHYSAVMDSDCGWIIKATCFLMQSNHPVVKQICHYFGIIRSAIMFARSKPFD